MNTRSKTRTCLWFESGGEEAARFYVTLLPDSRIESIYRTAPDQPALVVDFTLGGAPYQILNGGPEVAQSAAVSISVVTEDQAETDRLWDALTADGGQEGRCAWLTDRWGVSWQIVPRVLIESFISEDRAGAERAFQAMLTMNKVDVAGIEAAFRGD
ncbi:MAG: VOC family protein [Acidobacteria bacterium]|nr:VOC family protein [Acidobacteriota bacterium]MYE44467.1 VOC family protein [Acidobacteriota bacterium]MYF77972.1 VOC family protein [Acidobacteriota bacterium]